MKKLIYFLALIPSLAFAQVDFKKVTLSNGVQDSVLGTSIVLRDNAIIFQKVYATTLNTSELLTKMQYFLPTVRGFQLADSPNQQNEQFSGKLSNYVVNFRKYGGTLMGNITALNYPMSADVLVQVKENRYRVTISNIMYKNITPTPGSSPIDILLDEGATRKKRTLLSRKSSMLKALRYIDKDLSDSFDLNSSAAKTSTDF